MFKSTGFPKNKKGTTSISSLIRAVLSCKHNFSSIPVETVINNTTSRQCGNSKMWFAICAPSKLKEIVSYFPCLLGHPVLHINLGGDIVLAVICVKNRFAKQMLTHYILRILPIKSAKWCEIKEI